MSTICSRVWLGFQLAAESLHALREILRNAPHRVASQNLEQQFFSIDQLIFSRLKAPQTVGGELPG